MAEQAGQSGSVLEPLPEPSQGPGAERAYFMSAELTRELYPDGEAEVLDKLFQLWNKWGGADGPYTTRPRSFLRRPEDPHVRGTFVELTPKDVNAMLLGAERLGNANIPQYLRDMRFSEEQPVVSYALQILAARQGEFARLAADQQPGPGEPGNE